MELYVINTEGSEILMKRCSVVWNFKDVHEDFGNRQADLLEAQLKSSIGFMKQIRIVRGKYFVEVRPYGINKVYFYIFVERIVMCEIFYMWVMWLLFYFFEEKCYLKLTECKRKIFFDVFHLI